MSASPTEQALLHDFLAALREGRSYDPHAVLGYHPGESGNVVRAWHPDAVAVELVLTGAKAAVPMHQVAPGLFEVNLRDEEPGNYRLRFSAAHGQWESDDPYRFLPTLGELDLHLIGEGRHSRLWEALGARVIEHQGVIGTAFSVWAPNAQGIHLVGDANFWDERSLPMRSLGGSGIWEIFLPAVRGGAKYKFRITTSTGRYVLKADPLAKATESPPQTASIVAESEFVWHDAKWIEKRAQRDAISQPLAIYEVHLGSWRRGEDGRVLGYRELAPLLAEHCLRLGFTHLELMPVAEHPFGGSWGYQVTSYYAPTARYGSPDDFRWFIDYLHQQGIGVIADWVPAHFPRDEWALAKFDGTSLYEHADPRRGEHPDWGTLVFNYGRNEVRNFLIASARYWIEEFHIDGVRVDAVASMLYLDYSRREGEWLPNQYGGRENLEALAFIRQFNDELQTAYPGIISVAEESTAWPGVSQPTHSGGLGFSFKWNMGWMHDTLGFMTKDPVFRRYHHGQLTFGLWYAWSERFILPLSHDEVVHMKGSLYSKMPGDKWQKHANLRALLAWMWAHPGKKLLFMGAELAQVEEWNHDRPLNWDLLQYPEHVGNQKLVADLGRIYNSTPALYERDASPEGFSWIDAGNVDQNVVSFTRYDAHGHPGIVCVANFSPVTYTGFRIGLPQMGNWLEVLNTDAQVYGGSGQGNLGMVSAEAVPWHGLDLSAAMTLPPLGVLWLAPER